MTPNRVEIHYTGLPDEKLDGLRQRLDAVEGIEVHALDRARIELTYDGDLLDATAVQDYVEAAGGQLIRLQPVE